ncbi:MAG: homoserine kinase [Chloroflexota bacterium]|nr:homoserine kinase [Chloroflexota bacterium]
MRVRVEVPATTANLGAGFDALALALGLANVVDVETTDGGRGWVDLEVEGEGAGRLKAGRGNRFVGGLRGGLTEAGIDPDRWSYRIGMHNQIPLSRGLGSSAAATVGGLLAARVLAGPAGAAALTAERVLEIAAGMEGHPDNAAAAVYGGFVVVASMDGAPRAVRFDPPVALVCALFIPERPLSTAAMRAALPTTVPHADAVHNLGAAALCVAAFATGDLSLLRAATVDRLHEPYRAAAVFPELPALIAAAREAGALGACLSGAGSTVIAFADSEPRAQAAGAAMASTAESLGLEGRWRIARPESRGASADVD